MPKQARTQQQAGMGTCGLTLKCSATSHDSKALNSRLVDTPHSTRPKARIQKLLKCLVTQPMA